MTKIKNWRLALVAVCMAVVLCMIAYSFVGAPIGTANADGEVLAGNTASYTIQNDPNHPWIYERNTNTWYNNADKESELVKSLTLMVTAPGDIVFKYRANLYTSNRQGGTQHAFNNNDFYLELTKSGITNTIVTKHGEKMTDFEQMTVKDLKIGDKLVFKHKLGGSSTSDDDRVYVQGLTMPEGDEITITAKAQEGGTVSIKEKSGVNISETVISGTPLTVTAKPNDQYVFARWLDESGATFSYESTIELTPLKAASYTATFFKNDGIVKETLEKSWQKQGGTYSVSADVSDIAIMKFECVGEKYVYFSYMSYSPEDTYNDFTIVENETNKVFSTYCKKSTQALQNGYFHVTGEGYHYLEVTFENDTVPSTPDDVQMSDLEWLDDPKDTIEIELVYNQKVGTVYFDGVEMAPGNHTVVKGYPINMSAEVKSTTSTIDPTQTVNGRWVGWYTDPENVIKYQNTKYSEGLIWPDPGRENFVFTDEGAQWSSFKMIGHKIEARMLEFAAAPQVSVSAQIDGSVRPEHTLKNGERYEVEYGSSIDNVAILMKDFENIESTYHLKIDDVARDDIQIVEDSGRKMFSLSDIKADTKVTVYYSTDGYFDSEEFTFTIAIVYKGSLNDDLLVDGVKDISVENDEYMPWIFDASRSGENGMAFIASNSGSLGYYGKAVSSLKFTVTGAGVLDFDFKLYKRNCCLIYGDQPISITDTIFGSGQKDSKDESVWWINSTPDSWNRIIAQGASSPKEVSGNNYMYWYQGAQYDGGKSYYMTDDGWAHVSFSVGEDGKTKDVYVSYYRHDENYQNTFPYKDIAESDYAVIRNVGFWKGNGKVTFDISNEEGGAVSAKASEALTAGKKNVNSVSLGSKITFDVDVNEGYQFYGWVDQDQNLVSAQKKFDCNVSRDALDLTAIVEPEGTYYLRERGAFFRTLDEAKDAATDRDVKLYVIRDGLTVDESIEIPENVDIIFAIDDLGHYTAIGAESTESERVAWLQENKYKLYTFTVNDGATLTLRGGLYLGGVLHHPTQSAQAHTSGKYHQMVLNGQIVVEDGGVLDVCGRVTGDGGITVNKGGKLYQPFMILDYSGGTNTQAMFGENLTPFKMYSMVNIQCKGGFTINFGGVLYGHASLFFWGGVTTIDQPFVTYEGADGEEATALIILKDLESKGISNAKFEYDDEHARPAMDGTHNPQDVGKTKVTLSGGATAGYMSFPLGIDTSRVYFSVPYNFELILENGDYFIAYPYKLMPGAILNVKDGATLTVNAGAGLHVYDSFLGPNVTRRAYPTSQKLTEAQYNSYASLIVDGDFIVKSGAEFLGTVQTSGTTGHITIEQGANVEGQDLEDGVATAYTCNYTSYRLETHIYERVNQTLAALEAGKSYSAVMCEDNWILPGIVFNIETTTSAASHGEDHKTQASTTPAAQLRGGAWMVDHSPHDLDWTPDPEEYAQLDKDHLHTTIHRQCKALGCGHIEYRELLFVADSLGDIEYNGKDVTAEQLGALFENLYGTAATPTFTDFAARVVQINPYNATISLDGGFWLVDGEYKTEHTLTFKLTPKAIKVTPDNVSVNYGDEISLDQRAFSADGICGNDSLNLTLGFEEGVTPRDAGDYKIIVELGNNPNYTITTGEGVFTVKKLEITVTLPSTSREYNGKAPALEDLGKAVANKALGYDDSLDDLIEVAIDSPQKDAALYTVSAKVKAPVSDGALEDKNYKYVFAPGTYEIAKRNVTVTATDKQSVFGQPLKQLEFTVATLVGEESIDQYIDISTSATENSPVASYDIVVGWKDESRPQNYEVTAFNNGHYNIVAAGFGEITFDNTEYTYDGEAHLPVMHGAPEGAKVSYKLKQGEQFSEDFAGAIDFGTYEIEATVSLENYNTQNYRITLTVKEREITVDLPSKTRPYDGKTPDGSELEPVLREGFTLGKGDNLADIVDITVDKASKNVGQYSVKGVQKTSATNYKVSFGEDGVYEIKQAQITIEIEKQSKVYDGLDAAVEQGKWKKTEGEWAQDETPEILLKLGSYSNVKDHGEYDIEGECKDGNYKVTFVNGEKAYVISKRPLTVAADAKQSFYGDAPERLTFKVTGNEDIDDGVSVQVTTECEVTATSPYKAEGYEITVKVENEDALGNYEVRVQNAIYTVLKREVTVTLKDQNDVYEFGKEYAWDPEGWSIDEETLAPNEDSSTLGVKLAKPDFDGAGSYKIVAMWTNQNYDVTFAGNWQNEDENKGKAGVYTIAPQRLVDGENDAHFILKVNNEAFNEQNPELYKYIGQDIELSAEIWVQEGESTRHEATVDPSKLSGVGVYTVTVTVNDKNYVGSKTYTVEVVGDDGYSKNLHDVLDALDQLVGDVTADSLTSSEEHFAIVKGILEQFAKLSDSEKKLGAEELEKYQDIVDAWNSAADIDENVIDAAKTLADSPIKWLYAAMATSAILAALYVVGKGGLWR